MGNRIVLLLDMDAFFAAIEERENPQFHGKPIVVGADPKEGKGRGVVSTANYEARKYGIRSAMPIMRAWYLCPGAVFLPVNGELYGKVSSNIMRILREYAEVVEQVSLDEAYVDVSFLKRYEKAEELAKTIRERIQKEEQLPASCGVGPNKMVAKIACEVAKPNGVKVVREKEVEKFMESLELEQVPGIGKKTAAILRASGFKNVMDLKRLTEHDWEDLFGVRGKQMYWRVRGIDEDPVETEHEIKSIGKEVTFEKDTRDPEVLIRTLEQLAKQVAKEVSEQDFYFRTVTVVCRFSGFETHTKSKTLKQPTNEEVVLRTESMKLFLRFLVGELKPVRLVGVRVRIVSDVYA